MASKGIKCQISTSRVVAGTFHGGEIEPGTFHKRPVQTATNVNDDDSACMLEEQGYGHDYGMQEEKTTSWPVFC